MTRRVPSAGARCAPYVVLLALFVPPLAAQPIEVGDVVVRELPGLPAGSTHGYRELVFEVTNRSTRRDHEVTLETPAVDMSYGNLDSLRRTARVPAGASLRLALHQPPLKLAGHGLRVVVDGRGSRTDVKFSSDHPADMNAYVSSTSTSEPVRAILHSQAVDPGPLPSSESISWLRAEIPAAGWSGNWLAYSGYDGILVTAGDVAEMPAPVRDALWRYVEAGGTLVVFGGREPLGSSSIVGDDDVEGMPVTYAGLGLCARPSTATAAGLSARQQDFLVESASGSRRPWHVLINPDAAHQQMPVIDEVRIPVRGLFLLTLLFAIVIGPVNVFFLTRRQARIHLLWTVPLAAGVTTLAVFAYAWLSEGLLKVHRSVSLTVLDQGAHRATTFGHAGYYTTLTPGGGLRFDLDTEVSPVTSPGELYAGPQRSVDTSAGLHLANGWMRARVPAYFVVRRNGTRRERLRLVFEDGGVEVTNGLGAEIVGLKVADGERKVYAARGPIAKGASARLEPVDPPAAGRTAALRAYYRQDLPKALAGVVESAEDALVANSYLAELAEDPFLETGLDEIASRPRAIVYGLLEEP